MPRIYRFAEFELDASLCEVRASGCVLALTATPLRLLAHLIEHRDRVVPKDELLRHVWPDVTVSDWALASALKEIRRALGDDGSAQRFVQTRRGQGYRFIGELDVEDADDPDVAPSIGRRALYGAPPPRSMCFTGRASHLARIEALLDPRVHPGVRVAIEGLAGSGKTELATQVAFRLAHAGLFGGGVYWLDADRPTLTPIWAGSIADQLHLADAPAESRAAAAVASLEELRDPVLIVLDDVVAFGSGGAPAPLPTGPHVSVLATTQVRDLGGAAFHHVRLGALERDESRELVTTLAGRDPSPGLDALIAHTDGHPLSLELAGAFLAMFPGESAATYLAELGAGSSNVEAEAAPRVRYERTVDQGLRAVWDRLSERGRRAWRLAACFEAQPASRDLAAAVGLDRHCLRELEERHLIQSERDGAWMMHRLTRRFGRSLESESEQGLVRRAFVAGCVAYARARHTAHPYELVYAYRADRTHLDAGLCLAQSEHVPGVRSEVELGYLIANACLLSGSHAEGYALLRRCVETLDAASQQAGGELDDLAGTVLHATALASLGQAERDVAALERAAARYRLALVRYADASPAALVDCSHALGACELVRGVMAGDLAVMRAAADAFRAALASCSRTASPTSWGRTSAMLGVALGQLARHGDSSVQPEDAIAALRAAIREIDPSSRRALFVHTLVNLGTALSQLGTERRSPEALREAIDTFERALPDLREDRVPTQWAVVQHNLACVWVYLGRLEGSTACFERAIRAARGALLVRARERVPEDWASTTLHLATATTELATVAEDAKGLEESAELLSRAAFELRDTRDPKLRTSLLEELGCALHRLGAMRSDPSALEAAAAAYRGAQDALSDGHRRCGHGFEAVIDQIVREMRELRAADVGSDDPRSR